MPIRTTRVIELRSSSAQGAGASATNAFEVSDLAEAQLLINVTAVSGTSPTLDVVVQTNHDNGSTWWTHTTVAQITAAGQTRVALTNFGKYVRLSPTVGGSATPTVTWAATLVGKN